MEAAVWGVIGTLIGALASLGGAWLTTHSANSLHVASSKIERDEKFRTFQRDTLIALQDALHNLMRLTAQGHYEDTLAFHAAGKWGYNTLSDEVNDGQLLARRHMLILVERVADDNLRARVKQLNVILTEISFAKSKGVSDAALNSGFTQSVEVLELIGTALRAQY